MGQKLMHRMLSILYMAQRTELSHPENMLIDRLDQLRLSGIIMKESVASGVEQDLYTKCNN